MEVVTDSETDGRGGEGADEHLVPSQKPENSSYL